MVHARAGHHHVARTPCGAKGWDGASTPLELFFDLSFAAFWIYFAVPIELHLRSDRQAFGWGYGHYMIFGSAAAIGAALEVATEQVTGESHVPGLAAAAGLAVSIALAARSAKRTIEA
jgi:hypothetical protein